MSVTEGQLRKAKHDAVQQRIRLRQRAVATKQRLAPGMLASDVRDLAETRIRDAADAATQGVKTHPIVAGAAVTAVLAWLFRDTIVQQIIPAVSQAVDDAWLALQDVSHRDDDI